MAEMKELPIAEKKQSGCGCGCIEGKQKDAKTLNPAAEEPKK
jgi:hypothetical protein